jgi:hypothetical protein
MALFLRWIWDIYDDVYTLLQPYEVYQKDFHSFKSFSLSLAFFYDVTFCSHHLIILVRIAVPS